MPAAKATPLHRPNLAGVINPDDLFKKRPRLCGDVHCIAKVSIHEHANGWECDMAALLMAPTSGNPQWHRLPGAVFPGPRGQVTADFALRHHQLQQPSRSSWSRSIPPRSATPSAVVCACAAFTFGLGYELWAKEEVTAEEPELVPADSPSSNSNSAASKKKAAPKPAATANPVEGDPLAERKAVLQRKLKAYAPKDKGTCATWAASMCERFEAAKAVEVLNIDWLHTEEQVTHTELFVTQYEAQLQQNQAKAAA